MNQDQKFSQLAELLKALSHYDRIRIITLLSQEGSMNVSALIAQLSLEQSRLSHHLTKMRDRGILVSSRRGREIHYSLSDPSLVSILTLLLERVVK